MRKILGFTLLTLLLAACGNLPAGGAPAVAPAPTETPVLPMVTLTPPPTFTPTPEFMPIPATPMPTEPPFTPIMTPDAYQVEHWREYQTELAKVLLADYFLGDSVALAFCEWDILGRSGQEVYVWADCAFWDVWERDAPAIIHLDANGAIQSVEAPPNGNAYELNVQRMFPAEVREKIKLYYTPQTSYDTGRWTVLGLHLLYRGTHPDEPPLIVLSALPIATPTP
jgi:hypothetical protein